MTEQNARPVRFAALALVAVLGAFVGVAVDRHVFRGDIEHGRAPHEVSLPSDGDVRAAVAASAMAERAAAIGVSKVAVTDAYANAQAASSAAASIPAAAPGSPKIK